MKEATGELTTTIIVIIGLVAVLAIGRLLWPRIESVINDKVSDIENGYIVNVR